MAQSKFDKEIENFLEKNWFLIVIGIAGFGIWHFRDRILQKVNETFQELAPHIVFGVRMVVFAVCTFFVLKVVRQIILYWWENKTYQYALIIPHESDQVDIDSLGQMIRQVHRSGRKPLERLLRGRDWYRFMMYRPKDKDGEVEKVRIYIGGTNDGIKRVIQSFQTLYKHAEVYPQKIEDIPFPSTKSVGGRLVLLRKRLEATLSLAKYKKDVLPTLIHGIQEDTWVDISFSPDNGYKLIKGIRKAEKEMKKHKKDSDYGLDAFEKEELQSLHKRYSKNEVAFRVSVSFASEKYEGTHAIKQLGHMVESFMADVNELRYKKFRKFAILKVPCPTYGNMVWTGSELLNLLHLPSIKGNPENVEEKSILFIPKGQEMLSDKVLMNGLTIGYLKHPFYKEREVRLLPNQLSKHGNITGGTGSGKTTVVSQVLQSVIDQFLAGEKHAAGFSLFDPKPEIGFIMLNRLLKAEQEGKKVDWSKVHYIRFRDTEHPPALNLFHRFGGEDVQSIVDSVMSLIKNAIPGHAQQTERLLKAIIGTLLCDGKQEHTILSIGKFLSDELFQARVIANLEGPDRQYYSHYWKYEVDTTLEDSKQAILNRLDIFRNTAYLKRMYGQLGFSLEIRKWLDEGHLVFYDVSGMSQADVNLTLGYIANQYHAIAQERKPGSKLHLLVIDEAHEVQIPILPTIIAKDRSFGLALWIITQSLTGQLNKELVNAMKEIGANFFICKQGTENADLYEKITQRRFTASYLKNLPELTAAIQTQDKVNGETRNVWCTVTAPPLDKYLPNGEVATYGNKQKQLESDAWTYSKIRELENRGKHVSEIDDEINTFLYGMPLSKQNKEEKKAVQLQKAQQSNGSIFEFQEDEETDNSLEPVTVPQIEGNVTESESESIKEPEKKKVVRESLF
ncbi:type IV secretory system conjugative DNA transfer family protein [Bacillus pseudomycoides]|uniref:helicase HerA domain-containing protein n=1 Tax=Bacillus pseudomycoides TaxID=64104 RepID=UPI003D2158BE